MRKFTKQHRLNLSESLKQTFLNGRTIPNKNFVEVDCLNCKKQPLQIFTIAELRKAGAQAHFVTSLEEVKKVLDR